MVIDENDAQLGVMPVSQALSTAQQRGLDLVEVAPLAQPPVCRIMDWGKYRYEQQRKASKAKAGAKKINVKGIRLSFKIGDHDKNVRKKQSEKFLSEGDKIRVEIILRGRERAFGPLAEQTIKDFIASLDIPTKTEQPVKRQGHVISTVVTKA